MDRLAAAVTISVVRSGFFLISRTQHRPAPSTQLMILDSLNLCSEK